MTKAPSPTEKFKKQRDNTKKPLKISITQRLRTDLGRIYHIYTLKKTNIEDKGLL